jgi:hypothetical protein
VLLDGALGDLQLAGDAYIGTPLSHQSKHLPLPRAENGRQILPSARRDKLVHQGRVYHGAASGDPIQRLCEFLGVSGLTGHGRAGALKKARQARAQKHIVVRDGDPHPAPGGALSALSRIIYPHARPSANLAVGRMRWGGHMSHSSGGKPPCAAA